MVDAIVTPGINVIEAVHAHAPGATLVHVGSNAEYGNAPCPQRPDGPCMPNSAYGAAKLSVTSFLQAKAQSEGMRALVMRPFFVYGPGAPHTNLIESLISAAQAGKTLPMTAGEQTRDLVPVDKLATWIADLPVSGRPWGSIVNGCLGEPIKIRTVAERVVLHWSSFVPVFGQVPYRSTELMSSHGVRYPAPGPASITLLDEYLARRAKSEK
jgi:nucleoside-diphosphate-sugar epimerase